MGQGPTKERLLEKAARKHMSFQRRMQLFQKYALKNAQMMDAMQAGDVCLQV